MTSSDELAFDLSDGIATVTINRPERMNTFTEALLDSLTTVLEGLASDERARCVIIRGAGGRAFSCGMDLTRMAAATAEENQRLIGAGGPLRRAIDAIERYPYPAVAMISGYAVGAALELILACDLRVASEDCRVGMPPARLGIVYPPEGLARFVRLLGIQVTRKLFLTASYFGSADALAMGVVDYVVPAPELEDFTLGLARRLALNSPLSMKGHKRSLALLLDARELNAEERDELEFLARDAFSSGDAAEGMAAFEEKRDPDFTGR